MRTAADSNSYHQSLRSTYLFGFVQIYFTHGEIESLVILHSLAFSRLRMVREFFQMKRTHAKPFQVKETRFFTRTSENDDRFISVNNDESEF